MTSYSILQTCEGSGVHEAFKSPDKPSRWYISAINAIKASEEVVSSGGYLPETLERLNRTNSDAGEPPSRFGRETLAVLELIKPIVILDGKLFASSLAEDGELTVRETL